MNPHRTRSLVAVLLICSLATLARSAEPWEDAAIKGISSMNRGDGKTFAENSHSEFKRKMQKFMIDRVRATPAAPITLKTLKDFEVSSVDELEGLALEAFTQKMIHFMHAALPEPMRTALEEAEFKVIDSEAADDTYRVTVEIAFMQKGEAKTNKMTLLTKREDGVWKFNGDSR
jgi:hypothetical protein